MLEGTGVQFDWDVQEAGAEVIDKYGRLPEQVLNSIRSNGVAIKGPLTTPIGTGFRSVNVALRKEPDLYACLRSCKSYRGCGPATRTSTWWWCARTTRTCTPASSSSRDPGRGQGHRVPQRPPGPQDTGGLGHLDQADLDHRDRRIAKFAFEHARAYGRKKVTAVTKANIMKHTDGLFYLLGEVAKEYDDIAYDEFLVDNMCMQLVQKPENFDVLLLPNLYGDIISTSGRASSAGSGSPPGPTSATGRGVRGHPRLGPQVQGPEQGQPDGDDALGHADAAPPGRDRGRRRPARHALAAVIAEGQAVTYDMKPSRDDPTAVGTSQVADAVIAKLTESA